jgi:hypothetical protein
MSAPRYLWRQLDEKQRAELLAWRRRAAIRGIRAASAQLRASAFSHLGSVFRASSVSVTAQSALTILRVIC